MKKRKVQILVQKFIGLLLVVISMLTVNVIDGNSTIPMIVFIAGVILIFNNKTFDEIVQSEARKEIEENEDLK